MNKFQFSTPFRRNVILNEVKDLPFFSDKISLGCGTPGCKSRFFVAMLLRMTNGAFHLRALEFTNLRRIIPNTPLLHYSITPIFYFLTTYQLF